MISQNNCHGAKRLHKIIATELWMLWAHGGRLMLAAALNFI